MLQNPIDHRRLDQTRMNTIDADSFGPHLRGNIAGERLDRQFCRCIVSASRQDLARLDGTNVDDRTSAAGGHCLAAENLGAEPLSAQIDVDEVNPLLVSQLQKRNDRFNACVVHQHIDRSEFFLRSLEHGFDLRAFSYICLDRDRTPAFAPGPCRNSAGLIARPDVVDDHVCTFFGEHFCYAFADPLAGSGNDRYFIAELHDHPSALVNRPATIDHQHVSDHHVGKRAREKQNRTDQVLRLIPSPAWNHFFRGPFLVAGPLQYVLPRLGFRDARRNYVHQHPIFGPLEREGTRQMVNTCLSRCVNRSPLEGNLSKVGSDVDDSASSLRNHYPGSRLRSKKYALQRGRHGAVVLLFAHIESWRGPGPAGVVDQDVDASKSRVRLVHQGSHLVDLGNIGLHDQSLAPQRLDFGLYAFDLILAFIGVFRQHHVSPGLSQAKSDGAANTLGGAGDDGYLVPQPEA